MMNKIPQIIWALMAVLFAPLVYAGDMDFGSRWQVHGFLTQGYTLTDDNNFFGESDDSNGSFEFREIGVNVSGFLTDSLFASGQLISRETGAFYDGDPEVDYALLDWRLFDKTDSLGGVRIGRIKNPYGFHNDGRDAAVTRNGILLPQSIYFDKVRDLIMHSDGLQLYADISLNNADLFIQTTLGYADLNDNVKVAYLGELPGDVDSNDPLWVTRFIYEYKGGLFRVGYTKAYIDMQYDPASVDLFTDGIVDIDLDLLSLEYNQERWSLTAEYMQQRIERSGFSGILNELDHDTIGWYVQATFKPRPRHEVYLRYDDSDIFRDNKDQDLAELIPGGEPSYYFYAKDWTLGYRWDATDNLMLRAEYHNVRGTSWLSPQETPFEDMKKDWQMLNLLISYHF